jgi:CNT family concentrative nucleoside transporter
MQALGGILVLGAIAWWCSEARHAIRWRVVLTTLALQFALAAVLIHLPGARHAFDALNHAVLAMQQATAAGSTFVFGHLGGGPAPYAVTSPANSFILVFNALPLVIVLSALTALLTYWRVLPAIVGLLARALQRSLGLSGAVSFSAAANVFLGMVEAPLFVQPYLAQMTRAELFMLMTVGMSTIAGTVLVLYATILTPVVPDATAHLLIASLLSVPAGIGFSLLMVPETATPANTLWTPPRAAHGAMDALAEGTRTGLTMCLQIAAMLLVLVSLVHLVNLMLAALPFGLDGAPLSLEGMLGTLLAPLAWLLGIPWEEAGVAGRLLGIKTVLNELLAYLAMRDLASGTLSAHSQLILTYALCGFANIGSLGIMIAGLGELAPSRRAEIIDLGMRTVLSGSLATFSTGAVVGLLHA